MNTYKSIIRADYLQRARSYGFLITMLVSVCIAYTFVPPTGARYATVRIGDYVGENNAAWIGHITAIMASTFLWLLGFYLVNNGIRRDTETGVGQIVATTSISNFKYLLSKALSNFFVLLTITLIIMVMALALVIIRAGNYPFDAVQFFSPYLFVTIPSIFFVSVLAVFAEVVLARYPNLQNIGFFILFMILMNIINHQGPGDTWLDILGTRQVTNGMANVVNEHYSKNIETVSIGFIFSNTRTKYFLFHGTEWPLIFILTRLAWIIAGILLLFISSKIFRRFDIKERRAHKKKIRKVTETENGHMIKELYLSALPVAAPAYGIFSFVKIELLMLFRKGPRWFWLINVGVFIALWIIPMDRAHQIVLPVLWFLQINRWADIATKEKYNRTHYFTYAAYKPLQRLLASQIIAGIMMAVFLALPVITRYMVHGDYLTAFNIIFGACFIIALSVSSGIISGGKRLFEIVYFMLTYINISAGAGLDYFGAFHQGIAYTLLVLCLIGAMLAAAFLFRKYEISHQ